VEKPGQECAKPVNHTVLVQRLTVGLEPSGGSCNLESNLHTWRLVARALR